jgi:hypothetical protein
LSFIPDRYDGQGDYQQWLRHFDVCGTSGWSNADQLKTLPAFLHGRAAKHFYSLTTEQQASYTTFLIQENKKDVIGVWGKICILNDKNKQFYSTNN